MMLYMNQVQEVGLFSLNRNERGASHLSIFWLHKITLSKGTWNKILYCIIYTFTYNGKCTIHSEITQYLRLNGKAQLEQLLLAGREVARDSYGSFHNLFIWILPLCSTHQGPPVPGKEGMAHAIPWKNIYNHDGGFPLRIIQQLQEEAKYFSVFTICRSPSWAQETTSAAFPLNLNKTYF